MTRAQICAAVAEHYSWKLQGKVRCDYDSRTRKYVIAGSHLPACPSMRAQYPHGWELLDYVSVEHARRLARRNDK